MSLNVSESLVLILVRNSTKVHPLREFQLLFFKSQLQKSPEMASFRHGISPVSTPGPSMCQSCAAGDGKPADLEALTPGQRVLCARTCPGEQRDVGLQGELWWLSLRTADDQKEAVKTLPRSRDFLSGPVVGNLPCQAGGCR